MQGNSRDASAQDEASGAGPCEAEAQVREALERSCYQGVRNVTCRCLHGAIMLEGRVSSFYLKQLAQAAAMRIRGLPRLRNQVEVI